MAKQKVKSLRINWDIEFYTDIFTGNGFVITEPATFQLDESKQKTLYGSIQSRGCRLNQSTTGNTEQHEEE